VLLRLSCCYLCVSKRPRVAKYVLEAATRARSPPSRRVSAPRPCTPAPAPQIPAFQVVATTPVTGLGFDRDSGTEFDASGGSYGIRNGEWGLYLAAQGVKGDGWRYQSPSRIARFYGDLGWKGTDAEVHLVASAADNFFGVRGLAAKRTSQDLHSYE
jgi:hypothetical protein